MMADDNDDAYVITRAFILKQLGTRPSKPAQKQLIKCHFNVVSGLPWAWVCSVLDRQDAINELIKCVLRVVGRENGGPAWSAACQTFKTQAANITLTALWTKHQKS